MKKLMFFYIFFQLWQYAKGQENMASIEEIRAMVRQYQNIVGDYQKLLSKNKFYVPTTEQNAWLSKLEWCESGGNRKAINHCDLDGTPSFYSYQFKPATFKHYAQKYKILKPYELDTKKELYARLKEYKLQRLIVTQMLNDPEVKWENEFPGCVSKLGYPPGVRGMAYASKKPGKY